MKTFIYFAIVMVVFLPLIPTLSRGQDAIEGTYFVFRGDQKIETDEFEFVPGKKYRDEIQSTGAQSERKIATMICENGSLESYEQTLNGLPAIHASNDQKYFKLYEKEGMVGMFPVEEDILFLDPNIYSQFSFLIQVFEQKKKDKIRLNVCIPQVQDFIYVDIEQHGTDAIPVAGKSITATHYRISIGKKEVVNCWKEGDNILGMYFSSKNVYVTDSKYDQLFESLKRIVNRAL